MLAQQLPVGTKEKDRAVTSTELSFDDADDHVRAVRRGSFSDPLRLSARHFDSRVEVLSEFFAASRVARAYDKTIVPVLLDIR